MKRTRDVRESRMVKSYPARPPANHLFAVWAPTPIVSPEMEGDPLPKGADLQEAFVGWPAPDLIAVHDGIFSHNGHPHHLKLIVEPELPRPRVVLQFQFDQILRPALEIHLFPADVLRAD